ncbi:MAG TPA: histone H1-like repetitive region-containing protein [Acidimicrobiales bacterium]|nr:histone H1-like repetitive region-containing protein [Acidimicrobiales bacterium]
MSTHYVVVDGSNIATEGRSLPSLHQLDEAVKAFLTEHPADQLTVVVDATFGHRIDAAERDAYEEAVLAGELVSPPAGAIGRGDAFVLQIADKVDAVVLSNDSFQEFHGQYPWLFDEGRLIGGKPVPGLGWVFVLRTPVRGPASRRSVKEAKETKGPSPKKTSRATTAKTTKATKATKAAGAKQAAEPTGTAKFAKSAKSAKSATSARGTRGSGAKKTAGPGRVTPKKAQASGAPAPPADAAGANGGRARAGRNRRRRGPAGPGEPLNDLLPFVDFVAAHPVGSIVDAEVDSFSSHGAYVLVGDVRCYVPLKSMGDPPPTRARDVLTIGEARGFVVDAIDAPRRGIDLSLAPDRSGAITVPPPLPRDVPIGTTARRARAKASTSASPAATPLRADHHAEEAPVTPVKKAAAKKAAKRAPARRAAAKKAPARKTAAKKAPARKRVAKKAPARKRVAKKAPARKRVAKKAPARKAPARKRVAKKAPARKTAAKKAPARKRTAKKAPARKAPARKTAARKAPARKRTTRKAPARRR